MSLLQPTLNSVELCRNCENFAGIVNMSCMSYLWNLNVSSVLIFKLCKETVYLLYFTVRHYWVTDWLFSFLVITYIKWAVRVHEHLSTSITHFLKWPKLTDWNFSQHKTYDHSVQWSWSRYFTQTCSKMVTCPISWSGCLYQARTQGGGGVVWGLNPPLNFFMCVFWTKSPFK